MGLFSKSDTHCINCGKETNSKRLCRECNVVSDDDVYYCAECGEEFTKNKVVYVGGGGRYGYMCHDCYRGEY